MHIPSTRVRIAATGVLIALIASLVGCTAAAPEVAPETAPGGVAYGADKEAYAAAFAEIEPIELRVQAGGPEGSLVNTGIQNWADAVEDWSDGRISFEIGYGYSLVPNATEWAAALNDGRLDAAYFVPYFTPETFPALSRVANATFLAGNQPAAALESAGWLSQIIDRPAVPGRSARSRGSPACSAAHL